jgi:hypothetical protein
MSEYSSVNIVVLTYIGALVGFIRKIVSSVHGHGQDKIPAAYSVRRSIVLHSVLEAVEDRNLFPLSLI